MSGPAKSKLTRIWEVAIPSQIAPIYFLPDDCFPPGSQREDFEESKYNAAAIMSFYSKELKPDASGMDVLRSISEAMAQARSLDEGRQRLWEQGQALIARAMKSGDIRAFGFENPRSIKDLPVELDYTDLATAESFRWSKGVYKSHGVHVIEVRFMAQVRMQELLTQSAQTSPVVHELPAETDRPSKGRPTIRPQVEAAFQALSQAGKIDLNAPRKHNFPLIKQWIVKNCSELPVSNGVPSDEAIRRILKPLFEKAEKGVEATKKQ